MVVETRGEHYVDLAGVVVRLVVVAVRSHVPAVRRRATGAAGERPNR